MNLLILSIILSIIIIGHTLYKYRKSNKHVSEYYKTKHLSFYYLIINLFYLVIYVQLIMDYFNIIEYFNIKIQLLSALTIYSGWWISIIIVSMKNDFKINKLNK